MELPAAVGLEDFDKKQDGVTFAKSEQTRTFSQNDKKKTEETLAKKALSQNKYFFEDEENIVEQFNKQTKPEQEENQGKPSDPESTQYSDIDDDEPERSSDDELQGSLLACLYMCGFNQINTFQPLDRNLD